MGVLVVESEAADPWIPPPPKKKWIRHYLRGEIPKDYTTFSSSAAAELSPLASSPPSPPSVQVPAPPQNHLPTTNGLCSYSPPSSSASSSPPPPPIAYSRPLPSPPPPPPHPTPPADTHLPPLREDTPPPLPQYLSSSSSPLRIPPHHHALPVSPLQPPPPLPSSSSSSTAPILHNHLHQHQLHQQQQQRPPSPRSACTSPSSSSSVSVPSSSSAAAHNPPFHDFQAADGGYAGVKSEDGDGSSGGGVGSGGGAISSSSSPSRTFRRITVSSQLARLEEAQELRRRVGSGTREVHNKLEKNRRAHLKECFELLKKQLPASQDEKKSSNLSILHSALRYIQSLKRKERDYEHEMERLAREKIASQQRLSALKKELSAQWDHIDFNALLPPDSVLSATGGGASPRRAPEDEEEEEREDSVMGADGGNSSFGDRMRSRKELGLPITSDHNSNSTSTASERGHLSDDVEDVLPYRSNVPFPRGPPLLLCHSLPPGGGKRSPRPIHGGSTPASPTPPPPPPQRSSVLQQHRLASPSATPPSSLPASPTHTPPPRTLAAPGSPRPSRRLSPTRQMLLPEMHHQHPEEVGIAVTTIPTAHVHVPAQVVRAPPGLATALVSPGTAIHLLTTSSHNHQRHHIPGLYQTTAHGPHLQQLRVPTTSSTSTSTSPKAASPISSNNSSPSSPLLLGSPSQQPLALTVHAHPATNHHFHHSSQVVSVPHKCRDQDSKTPAVSSTTSATAISVPTIHLAGKVVQHSMAFLGPPTTTTAPGASELSHDLEGAITSSSSGKYVSPQHHHLQQQPAVAITGGSITLPNGVVAHASSANAGVAITQAVSPTNSARGSLPTSLTLAHSPTSAGGTTTMLTTAIHGAGTTPISALPTHLTQAGITHLVAPIGGGHAALVTTSGAGAGAHPLMAPLALVSSTGGPVAAHILGTAPASSSGAVGATVGGKPPFQVMASGAAGALPLLKPVAVSGQLPIMNAQYLTTAAALGGLAHLVKPLVVVSSAPSAPNHGSSSKLPSSLAAHSEPSPPQ